MKIVHLVLRAPYTDNWGYQENILPRCQARLGEEVFLIVPNQRHTNSGDVVFTEEGEYKLEDGVVVKRISANSFLGSDFLGTKLGNYRYLDILEKLNPDIIFVHGLYTGYVSTSQLKKYKNKHKDIIIIADSHEYGFGLGEKSTFYQFVMKFIRRIVVHSIINYYEKVYCLAPNCITFAKEYYGIPSVILSELPLGFDDSLCDISKKKTIRNDFRTKYGLDESDYLFVHGGKIIPRRRTELAIQAVKQLREKIQNVKLFIFGEISSEIKPEIEKMIDENSSFVIYLGHQTQEEYLKAFFASDIGLFPGAPSALWQEAIGCGLFLILCEGNDAQYLNRDNNVLFCKEDKDDIEKALLRALETSQYKYTDNPEFDKVRRYFSYMEMSKQIENLLQRDHL